MSTLAVGEFRLSDYFAPSEVRQNGVFSHFGNPSSQDLGALAFCGAKHYIESALANPAVSAIVTDELLVNHPGLLESGKGLVVSDSPRSTYWHVFSTLVSAGNYGLREPGGREVGCVVHPSAIVGEHVQLGRNVVLGERVIVLDGTTIGDGCEIQAGAIIGAEGMQYYPWQGIRRRVPHAGGVRLGAGVSILAGAVVSKAVLPVYTEIGDESQISILTSVGHQSKLGKRCALAGNVLIGGSVIMGDDVYVGPSVVIKDGIKVGDAARIIMGSVVIDDVKAGKTVSGNFARNHLANLRAQLTK